LLKDKAAIQEQLGSAEQRGSAVFPVPQFVILGRQSVGKSRLLEAIVGNALYHASSTVGLSFNWGSRRPTVFDCINVPEAKVPKWAVIVENHARPLQIDEVCQFVGTRHAELGRSSNVSAQPIFVRMESADCIDAQFVDMPGFREPSENGGEQAVAAAIEDMHTTFLQDRNNVLLCVEQASEDLDLSALQRCQLVDPKFERTVLILTKFDMLHGSSNAAKVGPDSSWLRKLPGSLEHFVLSLPSSKAEDLKPPDAMTDQNKEDLRVMDFLGYKGNAMRRVGFRNFQDHLNDRMVSFFVRQMKPVLINLQEARTRREREIQQMSVDLQETAPKSIEGAIRRCGEAFASALDDIMQGCLYSKSRLNLEDELKAFHEHHKAMGSDNFMMLPSDIYGSLADYVDFLRLILKDDGFSAGMNGGAQFERLVLEVQIFMNFASLDTRNMQHRSIMVARGHQEQSTRETLTKLLSNEGLEPMKLRLVYVGERLKWFFASQKEAIVERMHETLDDLGIKLLRQPDVQELLFEAYDKVNERHMRRFVDKFEKKLLGTFKNPWMAESDENCGSENTNPNRRPSSESAEVRKFFEAQEFQMDQAQAIVQNTFGAIRSEICEQIDIFAECFFKLPFMTAVQEMSQIEIPDQIVDHQHSMRERLAQEINARRDSLTTIQSCIRKIDTFYGICC